MPNVDLEPVLRSVGLLFVLLNPFLMSIYLMDLIETLDDKVFLSALLRGTAIATVVFCLFAIGGDAIFSDLLQVRFASFLVFGGILFLLITLKFVQDGPAALAQLRGPPEHIAGSIAMPFMVGPATVSASVLTGARLPVTWAVASIGVTMVLTVAGLLLFKWLHDHIKSRNADLVSRYVDVVGRASALLVGTIAVDMIFNGIELWWNQLSPS